MAGLSSGKPSQRGWGTDLAVCGREAPYQKEDSVSLRMKRDYLALFPRSAPRKLAAIHTPQRD